MDKEKFRKALEKYRGKKIYLGFSGGADSTALLLLLHEFAPALDLTLEAVHFDHQLRPDSIDDAIWCETFCRNRKIPCQVVRLTVAQAVAEDGDTIEAAARRCRLAAWQDLAGSNAVIALGHHAGDRVENLLLRLGRGSNVTGLTSMRAEQVLNGMWFIRPLLAYDRAEIIAYLQQNELNDWREDYTNQDNRYRRNFFRNAILPQIYQELPGAEEGMRRSLEVLEQDADFIEMAADGVFAAWDSRDGLSLVRLNHLHPALGIRILRRWLYRVTGEDIIPERHLLERLAAVDDNGETTLIPVRGGLLLEVRQGMINPAVTEEKTLIQDIVWNWRAQRMLRFGGFTIRVESFPVSEGLAASGIKAAGFNPAMLPETLTVRSWREGDQMIPFGRKSPVKLKKLFIDAKLTAAEKRNTPVVALPDGTIIWVAGLRRSGFAPVNPTDTQAVIFYL